jgi:glycosyltransferase involved in cell wall biosynthesis
MRIAIATDWFAPRRGGIEAQLAQLAAGLARRGHEVDVLTTTPGAVDGDGFRVRRVETAVLPRSHVPISPAMVGALREALCRDYDVVHAHVSVVSPLGYLAAGVARSLGLATVLTFHSVLRLKRHLLRFTNAVTGMGDSPVVWTAVSELVAGQASEALGGAEVDVLSNGIDLTFWQSGSRRVARATQDVVLVSTMRLHSKKRPRQLLTAYAQAARRVGSPSVLRIVGDGPEASALQGDIRALGLDEGIVRVEMLGWLSPEALRTVYAAADGFVLASERESFGIAALEAAAAGLPVIAMAAAGCGEFLDGESGLICADDAALAATLARFIGEREPREPNVSRSKQLDAYDWRSVLSKHEVVYERAIARSAAAASTAAASG